MPVTVEDTMAGSGRVAAEGDRYIGRSKEGMGERCGQNQSHGRRQRRKRTRRKARIGQNSSGRPT